MAAAAEPECMSGAPEARRPAHRLRRLDQQLPVHPARPAACDAAPIARLSPPEAVPTLTSRPALLRHPTTQPVFLHQTYFSV